MDAAKGLAIILVVFGHVLGGVLTRDWLAVKGPWRGVYDFIYLFHMPLFFMISGLLLRDAACLKPVDALVSRVGSIVWPYLLWDVSIRWALLPFIGHLMGSPPADLGALQWLTKALLGELSWFFWTLFLLQAIYIVVSRAPLWPLLILSFIIAATFPNSGLGSIQSLIDYMPFLLVGVAAHSYRNHLEIEGSLWQLATAIFVFTFIALCVGMGWTDFRPFRLFCSLAGIFATIIIVQCMRKNFLVGFLSRLGIASLAVFVMHPYFQGAARVLVSKVFGCEPFIHILVQTIAAITGPFLIWLMVERIGASWLFRLDFMRRKNAETNKI
jgi:fucose 4-O-acetylase-like acetyltransferase